MSDAETPSLTLTPQQGPSGSTVTLAATELPKDVPVTLGVGAPGSAYQVLQEARSSNQGTLTAHVKVPDRSGNPHIVFSLRGTDAGKLASKPFAIVP